MVHQPRSRDVSYGWVETLLFLSETGEKTHKHGVGDGVFCVIIVFFLGVGGWVVFWQFECSNPHKSHEDFTGIHCHPRSQHIFEHLEPFGLLSKKSAQHYIPLYIRDQIMRPLPAVNEKQSNDIHHPGDVGRIPPMIAMNSSEFVPELVSIDAKHENHLTITPWNATTGALAFCPQTVSHAMAVSSLNQSRVLLKHCWYREALCFPSLSSSTALS